MRALILALLLAGCTANMSPEERAVLRERMWNAGAAMSAASNNQTPMQSAPGGTGCFARGEQTSGFNKICYYDCMGSARAITIGSTELCPLTL